MSFSRSITILHLEMTSNFSSRPIRGYESELLLRRSSNVETVRVTNMQMENCGQAKKFIRLHSSHVADDVAILAQAPLSFHVTGKWRLQLHSKHLM
eukprot:1280441-Amphidinium_carterae.1